MLEHEPVPGKVENLKVVSTYNSMRIAEYAFQYCVNHGRRHITVVHNADVLAITEGLFVEAATNVSKRYPKVKMRVQEVGATVVSMVQRPQNYDVILATNLNGSMMSNFLSGMIGGPGLSSGQNLSEDGIGVFEPGARNKGSGIVGKGIANPIAMFLAAVSFITAQAPQFFKLQLLQLLSAAQFSDSMNIGSTSCKLCTVFGLTFYIFYHNLSRILFCIPLLIRLIINSEKTHISDFFYNFLQTPKIFTPFNLELRGKCTVWKIKSLRCFFFYYVVSM